MKNYDLKPKGLNSLDDLYIEQKYCIFILDSFFKDYKEKQERIELLFLLKQVEETNPIDFLPKEDREGIGLTMREKQVIGESMKKEAIQSIKQRLNS